MMKKLVALSILTVLSAAVSTPALAWMNTEDADGRGIAIEAKDAPKAAPYAPDDKYNNSLAVLNAPEVQNLASQAPSNAAATASASAADNNLALYAPAAGGNRK